MLHQILRILILKVTTSPIQILTMLIIILHPRLLQLRLLQKTWRQDSKGQVPIAIILQYFDDRPPSQKTTAVFQHQQILTIEKAKDYVKQFIIEKQGMPVMDLQEGGRGYFFVRRKSPVSEGGNDPSILRLPSLDQNVIKLIMKIRLFSHHDLCLFLSAILTHFYLSRISRKQVNGNQSHHTIEQLQLIIQILSDTTLNPSSTSYSTIIITQLLIPFILEPLILHYNISFRFFLNLTMEQNQQYSSLIDMGCSPILCQAAIRSTKSQDLSALLDWISENSEKEEQWKEWLQKQGPQEVKIQASEEVPQSIDNLINKAFSEQLQKKGFSKNVAQKSLLFSSNTSVAAAQKWIQQHKYDPDFEEQTLIVGQQANQPQLSPEEARKKLDELVKKARAIKKVKEEEEAREREKNRVKSGKEMVQAKRILQEQAAKRQVELDRIQKAKDDAYKKNLLDQMRRERNQKFGIKQQAPSSVTATVGHKKVQINYSKPEQVQIQCEQVKVGNHAYPEKAKTFFETAQIYVSNIIKNNGEQKFRKINKQNKAFQSRVTEAFAGIQTLLVIGYEDDGSFLIMKHYDLKELQTILKIIQRYISYYN